MCQTLTTEWFWALCQGVKKAARRCPCHRGESDNTPDLLPWQIYCAESYTRIRLGHRAQPALADGLHLPEGDRLGLVLSLDRAGRLLTLHRGLEAVRHDAGQRRH